MRFFKRYYSKITDLRSEPDSETPLIATKNKQQKFQNWREPDGLLAWITVTALFFIRFIILGHSRIAGILYVDFIRVFHISREAASVPYSVQQSVRMLSGPVVGILGQKFGVTAISVTGCVIATVSCGACFFAQDIKWITFLWGVLYGLGIAFSSTVNLVLVEQYFVKYKSTATGITFGGTCVGAFFFSILSNFLLDKYGIRGNFLITGSIIMYTIPVALLLREKEIRKDTSEDSITVIQNSFSENEAFLYNNHNKPTSETENTFADTSEHHSFAGSKGIKQKGSYSLTVQAEVTASSLENQESILLKSESGSNERQNITDSAGNNNEGQYSSIYPSNKISSNRKGQTNEISESYNTNGENITVLGTPFLSRERSKISISTQNISLDDPKECLDTSITETSNDKNIAETSKTFTGKSNSQNIDETQLENVQNTLSQSLDSQKHCDIGTHMSKISIEKGDKSIFEELKYPARNENAINFKLLHRNSDLVFHLLSNKIPVEDEEIVPSSDDVTQIDLESADSEIISLELHKIETYFQKPYEETQQYLNSVRSKLKRFQEQLVTERRQILKKELDVSMKCKDVRHVTIDKPNYNIEILEYTCEMPAELYIPIKLKELYATSSSPIISHYSNDKLIYNVLRELRKLHEIFNSESFIYNKDKWKDDSLKSKIDSTALKSHSDEKVTESHPNTFCHHIKTAFKIHMNPMFWLCSFCCVMNILTYVLAVSTIVDFAMDRNMTKLQGIYAIIVLSGAELFGRLCIGWVTDVGYIGDAAFMVIVLVAQGICSSALPQTRSTAMFFTVLTLFAIFHGAVSIKYPILLMKYLKRHEQFIGLGFLSLLPGIVGFLIPYYIGYARDYLGSYDIMYYINGGMSAFVGVLWLFEPLLKRFAPAITDPDNVEYV